MRYTAIILTAIAACSCDAVAAATPSSAPGELLIRYSAANAKITAANQAAIERLNQRFGLLEEVQVLPVKSLSGNAKKAGQGVLRRWQLLRFSSAVAADLIARQYARVDGIELAQPNYLRRYATSPNDSLFRRQWNLTQIGWGALEPVDASHLIVAVIDSGLDYTHPDIAAQVWINERERDGELGVDDDQNGYIDDLLGWDFTHAPGFAGLGDFLERDSNPMDESGHGTHVAGIIGASANNGAGIAGVASGVRIMPLRAGFNLATGGFLEDDDLAAAIVYAVDNGADILNMSWGDPQFSPLIRDVIRYAESRGTILVAAAGNDGKDEVFYPAKLDETIAVGASGSGDVIPGFTNSGPSIDVAAPGTGIWSLAPGGSYVERTGTSMAAAHVSGIVAALMARTGTTDLTRVKAALALTARDIGPVGWDVHSGAGIARIDAVVPMIGLQISTPSTDDIIAEKATISLRVIGEVGPLEVSWRKLESEADWSSLFVGSGAEATAESLGWDVSTLPEGRYELRVRSLRDDLEDRVEVRVQRHAPRIKQVELTPVLDGPRWDYLLNWETDEPSGGEVLIISDDGEVVREVGVPALSGSHTLTVAGDLDRGEYLVRIRARSGQLQAGEAEVGGFSIEANSFAQWNLTHRAQIENGYLMPMVTDFNANGASELVQMATGGNPRYGAALFYEFDADGAREVYRSSRLFIPWSGHDLDRDGLPELMAVDAQRVRLLEAEGDNRFPQRVIWEQREVWGGEVGDLDGDGGDEMFLRASNADIIRRFENNGDNQFAEAGVLANPTSGTNELGDRHIVGDLDGDGRGELLIGDGDGDLFVFENFGRDSYRVSWSHQEEGDIDGRVVGGGFDIDGDMNVEFVSARLLRDAVHPDRQRWRISIFEAVGDDEYAPEWSVEVLGGKSNGNGIASGDLNGDGLAEVVVAVVPDLYVFTANGIDSYEPVWHAAIRDTRRPVIGDLTATGAMALAFNVADGVEVRAALPTSGLLAPAGLRGYSASDREIALTWDPLRGAAAYRVYRDGELVRDGLPAPGFRDADVDMEGVYSYAVAAVDAQGIEGNHSVDIRVELRPLAQVLSVVRVSPTHLAVQFGEAMAALEPFRFRLEPGIGSPTSLVQDRGDTRAVLGFEQALPDSGLFQLMVDGARSADGTPLAVSSARLSIRLDSYSAPVRVSEATVVSPLRIELRFDGTVLPDPESDSTFVFADGDLVVRDVEILAPDRVGINLDSSTPLRARGQTFQLVISDLRDANGHLVNERVALRAVASDLGAVAVFPNPFRPGRSALVFANLTAAATVRIYDTTGQLVRALVEDSDDGGLEWDGSNSQGRRVDSGIYYFTVSAGAESVTGKFAVLVE